MTDRLTNALKSQAASLDRSSGRAKFALVSSVNYQTGYARVLIQPDGVLTGWLPVLSSWVGSGWGLISPPQPGDQVFVIPQDGDAEQGVIVGRTYSSAQMPPPAPDGELWMVHKSGSYLKGTSDQVRLSRSRNIS
jgi:phage baseplate assembly protein V